MTVTTPSLSSLPNPATAAIAAISAHQTRRSVLAHVGAGIGSALLATGAPIGARAATTVWPIPNWPLATPESVGLNKAKLLEAQAFATKFAGGAGCVIRRGKLVHSWGTFKQRYPINSATKSWGSVVLRFALDDGRFTLGTKVQSILPNLGYKPTTNSNTGWLDDISFELLASHAGGFDKSGKYAPLVAKPASKYIYSDTGPNWLANALTNAYRQDLRQLTLARLFQPLGLTNNDIYWRKKNINFPEPVYGIPATEFNGGMSANVDAMARLGYLFLNGGYWNGRQIVSSSFVATATKPYFARIPISMLKQYGLLWWNNGSGYLAGVPRDAYWSTGKNNNHTLVVPSLDLIAVRIGTDGWSNHGGNHAQFFKPICEAVVG